MAPSIEDNAPVRLEALVRLIETSDFLSFREIALRVLALRGYSQPSLTDGPHDGGTDMRVFQLPPNPTRLAVQVSVERDWRGKIRSDAGKVRSVLALGDLLFLSSRRLPEAEFQTVADDIFREHNVRVTRIDAQGIASTFVTNGVTGDVLEILGIAATPAPSPQVSRAESARLDAAYSFVFFGNEPQRFRERMIESAVITVLAQHGGSASRAVVEDEARVVLQLPDRRRAVVTGSIDRMLQRGDVSSRTSGSITLDQRLLENAAGIRLVREREWRQLAEEIQQKLHALSPDATSAELVAAIMDDIGALLMSTADMAVQSLERSAQRGVAAENIRRQLRHMHASLDGAGFPAGEVRNEALRVIAEVAGASPVGKHIVAGEVYRAMSAVNTPSLVRALGSQADVYAYLDASVAIPVLASLLYEPATEHRYFIGAMHAYEQLDALDLPKLLPVDYLEKVATHLYQASLDYGMLVGRDPDLIASENAFVAHYAALSAAGKEMPFERYLAGFGFDNAVAQSDFYVARDTLMPRLRRHFDRFGIRTVELGKPRFSATKAAEEMIARAINALGLERPTVLLRHDARTLASFIEAQHNANRATVFCTWDSLHFWMLENEHPTWDVMDPGVLGDLLAVTSHRLDTAPLVSAAVVARFMTDEAAREGAAVWDVLVRIERGKLHNAELLAEAQAFKREYLVSRRQGLSRDDVAQAWVKWKAKRRNGQ